MQKEKSKKVSYNSPVEETDYPHVEISGEAGYELKAYLGIIRRRLWIILIVFLIVLTLGVFYAFKQPPVYQASARVLIQQELPQFVQFGGAQRNRITQNQGSQKTQMELIKSPAVLKIAADDPRVAEFIGKENKFPDKGFTLWSEFKQSISAILGSEPKVPPRPPEPWEKLRDVIDVAEVIETNILSISAKSENPGKTAKYVNAVAEAYRKYLQKQKEQNVSEAFARLQDLKERQEKELTEAENALQEYIEKNNTLALNDWEGGKTGLYEELRTQLLDVRMKRMDLEARIDFLKENTSANPGYPLPEYMLSLDEGEDNSTLSSFQNELLNARKEVALLGEYYGPEVPQLWAAQTKLKVAEEQIEEIVKNRLKMLEARAEMLKTKERQLEDKYEEQKQTAINNARESGRYSRLKSRVERNRKLYDILIERMREVDLSSDYPSTSVEVIEAATIPDKPAGPNKIGMILLFCFFGLACGGGAAFFVDYMDNAVKIPEDIKNYAGLDVLGFVPVMDSPPGKEDEFRYHGLISALEPASSASEAYRQIRTKLFFSTTIQNCKTIVITSAGAGEGKTTTATNLACVMAQGGKRVLLLDADSRRPSLHRIVKCSSRPGLTSILMGQNQLDECTQPFKVDGDILEGVVIVPCGPIPPNPADVLGSDSMGRLLREAAEKYDRVLIDSPPVLVAADTSIICAHADGVIVVSRADETERSALRHCAEELTGVNAKLLGGVLNRVKVSRLNYYHSDYCYSGYSGYSEDYNNLSDSGLEEGI